MSFLLCEVGKVGRLEMGGLCADGVYLMMENSGGVSREELSLIKQE